MAKVLDELSRILLFMLLFVPMAAVGAAFGYVLLARATDGGRPTVRASLGVGAAGGVNAFAGLVVFATHPATVAAFARNLLPGCVVASLIGAMVGAAIGAYRRYGRLARHATTGHEGRASA